MSRNSIFVSAEYLAQSGDQKKDETNFLEILSKNFSQKLAEPKSVQEVQSSPKISKETKKTACKSNKKRVQCSECLKTFCDKGALKIHTSAVHLKEMHKCTVPGCEMMFSSRRSRNRHSANPNPKLHSGGPVHSRLGLLRLAQLTQKPGLSPFLSSMNPQFVKSGIGFKFSSLQESFPRQPTPNVLELLQLFQNRNNGLFPLLDPQRFLNFPRIEPSTTI